MVNTEYLVVVYAVVFALFLPLSLSFFFACGLLFRNSKTKYRNIRKIECFPSFCSLVLFVRTRTRSKIEMSDSDWAWDDKEPVIQFKGIRLNSKAFQIVTSVINSKEYDSCIRHALMSLQTLERELCGYLAIDSSLKNRLNRFFYLFLFCFFAFLFLCRMKTCYCCCLQSDSTQ
jgi:hypothetical protein